MADTTNGNGGAHPGGWLGKQHRPWAL